jgi:hypothetical protein
MNAAAFAYCTAKESRWRCIVVNTAHGTPERRDASLYSAFSAADACGPAPPSASKIIGTKDMPARSQSAAVPACRSFVCA